MFTAHSPKISDDAATITAAIKSEVPYMLNGRTIVPRRSEFNLRREMLNGITLSDPVAVKFAK
jgi:hypothetical protein